MDREHGGVSCYVKESIESELIEEFSYINNIIELCSVRVKVSNESYVISTIYRPSSKYLDVDIFDKELSGILKNDIFKKNKHVILGYLNINLLEFATH